MIEPLQSRCLGCTAQRTSVPSLRYGFGGSSGFGRRELSESSGGREEGTGPIGMGTALGLALTGLVFDIAAGRSSASSSVAHAFTVTALFLAALAIAAGIIAGLREGGPLERSVHARVE